jgi:hypothetical protein
LEFGISKTAPDNQFTDFREEGLVNALPATDFELYALFTIDSLVTDKDDWLFNAQDYLKYSSAEDWSVLPVDDRVTRQDLIDAGNQYFDFVFMDKSIRPPWGSPRARLEGGAYTNPKNENKDTCQIPAPLGDMYIVNRSYVVDEELGAINIFCRFGSETGMPDSHTFRLLNGRYRGFTP